MANYLLIESSSGFLQNIISWDGTIDQWDTSSGFILEEATSSFNITLGPDSNFYREVTQIQEVFPVPYTGSFTGSLTGSFNGYSGSLTWVYDFPTSSWGTASFTGSFTGSLNGTASYADTASYISSIKSGRILVGEWGVDFSGKYTASVAFNSNYVNTSYAVSLTCGADMRTLSVINKQTSGFSVNTNSITAMTDDVYWVTIPYNNP